ncbi:MAG TPA: S9 family peptidase [Candidatus Limnocylindria bacterium]|nr:S9 family peptidase [Candidatus Limnocylindria bacterium]
MPAQQTPTGRALVEAQAAIEAFTLSPDGERVAYVLRRVSGGRYVSHLWSVPWRGGRARRLTSGRVRDGSPAFSPDGRRIGFTRAPASEKEEDAQPWVIGADGGRPRRLPKLPHGASRPRWSPDGRRIALLGQAGDDRFRVGPERKGKSPVARRMTRTDFRDDESGFLGRRTHLWLVEPRAGGRPRQLTSGDFDVVHPSWAPDSRSLVYAANVEPDWNIDPRQRLFRVAVDGGEPVELASPSGEADWPALSPDAGWLACIGIDVPDPPDEAQAELFATSLPDGTPTSLTAALDRPVSEAGWADLVMAEEDLGPVWLDGETLVTIVSDRSRNLPYRVTTSGTAEPLVELDRFVAAGVAAVGGRVAFSAGRDGRAAEVYAVDDAGPPRRLTRNGSAWQERFPIPRLDELWLDGAGGPIQAWVASPAGVGLDEPLPTVFILHGGPTGSHAPGGTMDSTMLTGHGYRCVLPNIRGSASFGADWIGGLGGRWGETDAEDAMAVVDAMVARRASDPDRLGVMGLSYGGFLTQWLIGVTDRFGAAIGENGVTNQVSAWGNSFFAIHYNRRARLGDPLTDEGMQKLWSHSPLRNAARITTPLLILQAEEDRICPPADNEQLFTALRALGREVEYVLYPEEHHELKSYGRPDRRIDRMERILAWFERWIGPRAIRPMPR